MTHLGRGGAVVVVKPRYMSRGLCTCGWAARPRLLLSSAKIDALIHAAQHDCEPAVPMIQIGVVLTIERQGILDVDRPHGCIGQLRQVDHKTGRPRADTRPEIVEAARVAFHHQPFFQLTITDYSANAIGRGKQRPVSRMDRYRAGYSPRRDSPESQG